MKRIDERDIIFSRANYKKGSNSYNDYYKNNPDKKLIDDSIRSRPDICSEGSMTYNEINSPMASSAFDFLSDIKHLCEGNKSPYKVEIDKYTITKRLKGLANHYGAKLVGVTKLKDYHFYTHRGRNENTYGEVIKSNHKYAIAFAVPMDVSMINRGPMLAEVVETSKAYVDISIIGMILSYYIRNLGYDARNHMDSNYLLIPVLVAKDAGLGSIGRNTILTSKEYGSCIRLGVVTTTLELEVDEPKDFGLDDFCSICKKCAYNCPSSSLSLDKKFQENKNYNWTIDAESCYIKWRYLGTDCGICISVCPFSQQLETIKNATTFKGNLSLISEVLKEYTKKFGKRPFVPGNPSWMR
ncbi:4Fe-4S dicluster domain-containing protein [Paraclostridium sordellii]|uniref:4Fe-4S dicluster domain-containing protein n=1 Tax=Paraclostridium sordellii TaxID=1505 RepID=UPI0005E7D050|nr:4Fe-4S dicluster domain-containing protein [Paeniclostridium sordellii]CEO07508.1 reductive dehalogenase [[Clostridium] sordellii] [Paeniclostridium sordellii]CEP86912.1 reductive dehalogenase [[Clostridium] sordellii] [Paeniclostridium sordellii]CEP97790.1 reductive dehalogenase [[Clostridium] sordellii] [Paeniclostridium sordellii]CEP99374.1 reductive dehalogenase [[Clostridium] sordellii] [Paeniclostridium sordellii]